MRCFPAHRAPVLEKLVYYYYAAYSCSHTHSWGPRRKANRHDTPHPPRFDIRMPSQPSPQPTRLRASETQESRNTQSARRALELPRRSFRPNRMCSAQRSTTTRGNAQCLKRSQTMHMPTPLHVADPHEVPGLTMCQPEDADQCCASTALSAALSQPRGTAARR